MGDPCIWDAFIPDDVEVQPMLLSIFDESCGPLEDHDWNNFIGDLLVLLVASKDATLAQSQMAARIGNHQMLIEHALRKRTISNGELSQGLRHLEVEALICRPTEWRGRKVRCASVVDATLERRFSEQAKRFRWAQEVFGILFGADLPFVRTSTRFSGMVVE